MRKQHMCKRRLSMSDSTLKSHCDTTPLGPDNKDYSSYLPDGTLMSRQFYSVRTRTVVRVNSKGDTIVRTIREPVVSHRTLYRGDWEISGNGTVWRINTPEGIATVVNNGADAAGRTYTHLWYVRDRLGSVRTVVDDEGTIRQCTMFYPSGVPVQLFGTERVSDRAHIGNRWSNFAGLGQHDNTARWHDAILGRFTTPDPKSADYPSFSPYTHCAANPLRFTDPTGMDIYSLNSDGTFVLTMKTDDNFDTVVAESGSNINVPKTFFSSEVSGTGEMEDLDVESGTTSLKDFKYNYYELSGNGMELFEFLANNSSVEWSRLEFSDGNTIIGNSHIEGKDGTCEVFIRNNPERKKLIRAFDHTHPSTDEQSEADVNLVKSIESFAPKATFRVFYSKDFKLFHQYTGNSKGINLSQPIEMPPFIFEHKSE